MTKKVLTRKDLVVGGKYVPHQKTAGDYLFSQSKVVSRASAIGQPFLYYVGMLYGHHCFDTEMDNNAGDYFAPEDVTEYVEYASKDTQLSNNINSVLVVANHTPEREKELQELCRKVMNANPERYYNPNGADETICPFCWAKDYSTGCTADIEDIEHEPDCAYNIAKGLSTNI